MKQILTVILVCVTVVAILVGGWFGYWALAKKSTSNQYDVNTHNQQFQSGLVAQERNYVQGYDAAPDGPQKQQIKATFCQIYPDLSPAPSDLIVAHARIC
jgi:nitrogen fixation-related uncharacterized protein